MQEVIQQVLATELEAQRIVEQARATADGILTDAQKQAQTRNDQSRQETRLETEKILADAAQAAEQEKQARLAQATAAIQAQVRLADTARQDAVRAVVRCVCGWH